MDGVIVTGGARGIGKSISNALADAKYGVVINYNNSKDEAEKLAHDIKQRGGSAVAIQCDVRDFAAVGDMMQTARSQFGGIYGLVNCAGVVSDGLILRMTEDEFDFVVDTNLKGSFNCIRHASAAMIKQHRGRIINIGSVSGLIGGVGQSNYSASKAGLIGLTKSVARELAPRRITCNLIAPGYVESALTQRLSDVTREKIIATIPLKRMASSGEIAAMVEYLLSENGSYITGQSIAIDGGLSM